MKAFYDFSNGKRGAVVKTPKSKEKISIRLDKDVINWFREQVEKAGGGSYQSMMNDVLRHHVDLELPKPE